MKRVTFYSTSFCPTCKFLKPKVQEAYPDTEFVLLDDKQDLADALSIQSVPTIIFWDDRLPEGDGDDYTYTDPDTGKISMIHIGPESISMYKELARLSGGVTTQQFKETLAKVGML